MLIEVVANRGHCYQVRSQRIGHQRSTHQTNFNLAAAGPPRHPPAAGGHKVAPLYFCDDIVATPRDREAKHCTHLPEYLAKVVSKFGVDRI